MHGSERLVDADLLHNHHELFKRSGHQFNLGEKYERLGRDTQRALRATRENQNKLNYLEGRIRRLRDDVNGVPRGHADDEVDQMLKRARDDTTQLGFRKFFQKCDKCGARVTREHFEGHRRVCPGAPPELGNSSDDDAEAHHIRSGDRVRVTSRVGAVEVPVELTDDVMPGVVSLPHGYGHGAPGIRLEVAAEHAGASINDLTDPAEIDPLSGTAVLSGVPVRVQRREPD